MNPIKTFFEKREWLLVSILFIAFILIRIPGRNLPLHQDEYKWLGVENLARQGLIPHPPLGELIYHFGGKIVGYGTHFRLIPTFFGALNLLLLYFLVKVAFGKRTAWIASLIFIFSYFSVLASLMVDTDGEIMPFFFLISLIGYYKIAYLNDREKKWWAVLFLGMIGGLLIKASFVLAVGAILVDFLWARRKKIGRKEMLKYTGFSLLAIFGFVILLLLSKEFFPFFDLSASVKYWEHFFTLDRGWFQTAIQCAKAVLYTSPLLIIIPLIGWEEIRQDIARLRVFLFFLLLAFIFYVILFDFSIGALDRYLQLLVLPLTVLTSVVLNKIFKDSNHRVREFIYLGLAVSLLLILLQSISHSIPPLYPKSEWIGRIMSFRWNFVYPFSGGSGPLGFYISFLFLGLTWLISLASLLFSFIRRDFRKISIAFILPIAICYNFVFIEEYFVGYWNGNASKLVYDAAEFIKNDPDIGPNSVIVYNDNGAHEIELTGKYLHRLYVAPYFVGYDTYLNTHKVYDFVLDVPRINPDSGFAKYFSTCKPIFTETDKKMSSTVYDCRGATNINL